MTIQEFIVLIFAILCVIVFIGWLLGYDKKDNRNRYSKSDASDDLSDSFFDADDDDLDD